METILIVDDDEDVQALLSDLLRNEGYVAIAAGSGRRALRELVRRSPGLVLLDNRLPRMDGMKLLEEMKGIDGDLVIIMITGYGDVRGAVRAMRLGAFDYITKPFDNEELLLTIRRALEAQYLSKEVNELRRRLGEKTVIEEAMGQSPQIKQVISQVKIIAPTNMTVIIQGESGAGKELIARMIHQQSMRKNRPFIAIDCGAIPDTLVESELFGYEKGAFTGADGAKQGQFERAHGGTLFLDEITNLPGAAQAKLLRVIQERRLQHLGGRKEIKVDVRILVATNIRLRKAVEAGRFRHDLFHRLDEFQIDLPPLRARRDDIPTLADYFLREANQELNKRIEGFSTEVMKHFLSYHWPGNVRELKNVVRRAVLLTKSGRITRDAMLTDMTRARDEIDMELALTEGLSFEEGTKRVQRELIKKALEQAGGSKTKAAKILHLNRKTLYRKMRSVGL